MSSDRPEWWDQNSELREELGLPEYEPSRFTDGTYVHEVVEEIESEYGMSVDLVSEDPSYPSQWVIRLGGTACVSVVRRRDDRGNNVYQISADEVRRQIDAEMA
ncbi:hypothetical protein [Halobellus rufus]|uniref:hypothetical protein n=1 Tax=Halobellus rufus TaxID=1448860 RepID=UPI000678FE5D|nr:hypothetical protein [Halobellus rufus]